MAPINQSKKNTQEVYRYEVLSIERYLNAEGVIPLIPCHRCYFSSDPTRGGITMDSDVITLISNIQQIQIFRVSVCNLSPEVVLISILVL